VIRTVKLETPAELFREKLCRALREQLSGMETQPLTAKQGEMARRLEATLQRASEHGPALSSTADNVNTLATPESSAE